MVIPHHFIGEQINTVEDSNLHGTRFNSMEYLGKFI